MFSVVESRSWLVTGTTMWIQVLDCDRKNNVNPGPGLWQEQQCESRSWLVTGTTMWIQVLACDRNNNVAELNRLMGSQPVTSDGYEKEQYT